MKLFFCSNWKCICNLKAGLTDLPVLCMRSLSFSKDVVCGGIDEVDINMWPKTTRKYS